jgi:hypothetical protein
MSRAFSLHVPPDARFQALAGNVALRFAAMAGASETGAETFGSEVESGVHALALAGEGVDLVFESGPAGFEVSIRCGSHARIIRHALPAAQS